MNNCIYQNKFIDNGLSQSYGLKHNCKLISNDLELCENCIKYAKLKQEEFFNTLNNMVNTTKDSSHQIGDCLKTIMKNKIED